MNREELARAVNDLSEKHLEEALQPPARKRSIWKGFPVKAVAAVLAVALLGVSASRIGFQTTPPLSAHAVDLMEQYDIQPLSDPAAPTSTDQPILTDFALRMMQQLVSDEENVVLSPYSILTALAMTANGADGKTRQEMESVLGLPVEELNPYLLDYTQKLPSTDKASFHSANSIWLRNDEDLHIEEEFLTLDATYYDAGTYSVPFDRNTAEDINQWVSQHTNGMIPQVVDPDKGFDSETMLCLINALSFDAKWEHPFRDRDVFESCFTPANGDRQNVLMMGRDHDTYYRGDHCLGFREDYAGGDYAFVALLPDEGMPLREFVSTLTTESLRELLTHPVSGTAVCTIPVFDAAYTSQNLADTLSALGMPSAFLMDEADFSRMGNYGGFPLYVSSVIHGATISVGQEGTKAAAYTKVEVNEAACDPEEPVYILLNRPFLYMIVDTRTMQPLFLGAEQSIQ